MSDKIVFTAGTLPAGFCWENPQQYYDAIVAALSGSVQGSPVAVSTGASAPGNLDSLWAKTYGAGPYVGLLEGIYLFLGDWFRPHPIPPASAVRWIYRGTEADLKTYDGGVDEAVTATTGPFWEVDHEMDFLIPMGVGTNTGAAGAATFDGAAATAITLSEKKGAERVKLDTTELIDHKHLIGKSLSGDYDARFLMGSGSVSSTNAYLVDGNTPGGGVNQVEAMTTGDLVTGLEQDKVTLTQKSHQNLPPVIGVFFIKRTARLFIKG